MKPRTKFLCVILMFMAILAFGVSMVQPRPVWHWRPYPIDETCKLYLPFYKYGGEQSKIWDLSTSHNDGTISGCVPTSYPMLQPVSSGSVTQANMKISAVNGTAFVDFSAASVLTDYLNHLLIIKDSSGRVIQGYIKAAGAGEELDNEVLADPDFDATLSWIKHGGWTVSDGLATVNTASQYRQVYQGFNLTVRKLYKMQTVVNSYTQGQVTFLFDNQVWGTPITSTGTKTVYKTTIGGDQSYGLVTNLAATAQMDFSSITLKQVLIPSATGCTIVNQKGGATYNWGSKDANFNYNDSSGYTYTIYSVPGYMGSGWFGDGTDDRIVHTSLNLGTTHTLHYWLLYQGISGVIHGGAANYHGLRLTPTACGYNVGTTEVTVTHSANYGEPVLFSIDRNGTSVDFYKNGVKIGTTQTLLANTALTVTDFFRYSDGTSYWNGTLFDAVNINTNKGAQEIRNFFELTRHIYGI